MNKELREIKKELRAEVASALFIAADIMDAKANAIYAECPCGASEHIAEAKYCGACGRKLIESR